MTTCPPLFPNYLEWSRSTLSLEGARAVPQENPDSVPASQNCQIKPEVTGQISSYVQTQTQPWLPRPTDARLMDVSDSSGSIEQP